MSLVDDIKNQAKKSGANKGKFIYFKPGVKIRVRFLQDMDQGMKIPFHDSYAASINVPCQKLFKKKCNHCDDEELRHRDQYLWSVWNHETKEVQLLMGPVNNASPIPHLVGMYEAYGSLTDRDYVITKNGSGPTATFSVVPMDKVKFRNDKAKPYSEQKVLQMLDKAFPDDALKDDDDDSDDGTEYSKMSAKELYTLCKERELEAKPKMSTDYYIDLLEADDKKGADDDGWGDEEEDKKDYSSMSAKDLYQLCKERSLEAPPKKSQEFYIDLLEKDDESGNDDDWSDDEGEDW